MSAPHDPSRRSQSPGSHRDHLHQQGAGSRQSSPGHPPHRDPSHPRDTHPERPHSRHTSVQHSSRAASPLPKHGLLHHMNEREKASFVALMNSMCLYRCPGGWHSLAMLLESFVNLDLKLHLVRESSRSGTAGGGVDNAGADTTEQLPRQSAEELILADGEKMVDGEKFKQAVFNFVDEGIEPDDEFNQELKTTVQNGMERLKGLKVREVREVIEQEKIKQEMIKQQTEQHERDERDERNKRNELNEWNEGRRAVFVAELKKWADEKKRGSWKILQDNLKNHNGVHFGDEMLGIGITHSRPFSRLQAQAKFELNAGKITAAIHDRISKDHDHHLREESDSRRRTSTKFKETFAKLRDAALLEENNAAGQDHHRSQDKGPDRGHTQGHKPSEVHFPDAFHGWSHDQRTKCEQAFTSMEKRNRSSGWEAMYDLLKNDVPDDLLVSPDPQRYKYFPLCKCGRQLVRDKKMGSAALELLIKHTPPQKSKPYDTTGEGSMGAKWSEIQKLHLSALLKGSAETQGRTTLDSLEADLPNKVPNFTEDMLTGKHKHPHGPLLHLFKILWYEGSIEETVYQRGQKLKQQVAWEGRKRRQGENANATAID